VHSFHLCQSASRLNDERHSLRGRLWTDVWNLVGHSRVPGTPTDQCYELHNYAFSMAGELRPFAATADIGLHFTITDLEPIGTAPILAPDGHFPPLSRVLWLSLARRLPEDEIRVQLARQLDAFEQQIGSPPAHVDGHHHVHQLPGVREIVVEALRDRYQVETPYIRISHDMMNKVWHRGIDIRKCL
jgi:predicted glycoside hydrolase/deacetylase ChbG (UPF0249 family)